MKPILVTLLSFIVCNCRAQNILGFKAGVGFSPTYLKAIVPTPGCEGYYLRKLSDRLAVGAAMRIERYSFTKKIADLGSTPFLEALSVNQKSTYLYLSPKTEIAIGRRQNIKAALSFGAGKLLGGKQTTVLGSTTTTHGNPLTGNNPYSYLASTKENTENSISNLILGFQFSLSECFAAKGRYRYSLFEEFSFIPGYVSKPQGHINYALNRKELFIRTTYLSCGICIAYKYKHLKVR